MLRVKVCGMRRPADLEAARAADYVGFVVASPKSPRSLALDAARRLMDEARDGQATVAVTVETDGDALHDIADALAPDVLQLHRGAAPDALEALKGAHPAVALWVACDVDDAPPPGPWDALVVDARTPDGYGGTGRTTDWNAARRLRDAIHPRPLVLAGGLLPGNVARAAEAVRPAVVDVSSGVEAEAGEGKDPVRVAAFIRAARGRSE